MAQRSDFGDVNLDIRGGGERSSDSRMPFRILILGDFGGRHDRSPGKGNEQISLAGRRPKLVDRDNFDEVLAKSEAELALPGISQTPLQFSELDDFHPDRLFERASLFQKLRDLRSKLSNPSTYAEAVRDLGVISKKEPHVAESSARRETPDVSWMAHGNLLDDAIGATEIRSGGEAPARKTDDLAAFIRRAVEPHLASKADPQQAELLGVIDQAAGAQMRALLRLPEFQTIEAAWRAVFFLVRRVETDASIKIFLLDVSKEELAADLASEADLSRTLAYKVLVKQAVQTPGGEPWALLVGNYTFGRQDLGLLTRLAHLARAAGAPFITGA
ncbi:MAG TPA: type VI secretion system contractile sheath large subunit, partial [Terriglobia bacterium]|nr:type VI secretion system contractile sheath large subunit [Terriglobia bacterium]